MADELKIRISVDANDARKAVDEVAVGVAKVGQAAGSSAAGIAAGKKALDQYGQSAAATAAALRNVPAQFTDIVTGLAAGQSPLTVLLQQGGQLKDMFGGVGNAAKALGGYVAGLVNPFTVAAAAAAVLAKAYFDGDAEAKTFARTLILSGNAAATSAGQLQDMAGKVATATAATRGATAETLNDAAATGKVSVDMLEKVSRAAIQLERVGGQAASDTVKEFAALGDEPVKAVLKLDEKYHFLTASVLEQVKALSEQGRETDAAKLAQNSYFDALQSRIPALENQLGTLEVAWRGLKDLAKSAWDAMLDVGREDSTAEKLKKAQAKVAAGGGLFTSVADAKGEVAVWQAKLEAETRSLAVQESANQQSKAAKEWLQAGEPLRSKQVQQEQEIAKARLIGVQAGKTDAEIRARVAQINEKYADKTPKGRGGGRAPRADPLDAMLENYRRDAFAQEVGLSSSTVKEIENLGELLKRGKVDAREYGRLLDSVLDKDTALSREQSQLDRSRLAQMAMGQSVDSLQGKYDQQLAGYDAKQMTASQRELEGALRKVEEAATAARDALAQKAASLDGRDTPALEAFGAAIVRVNEAEEIQLDQVRRLQAERERLNGLWETGAERALTKYLDNSKSVAEQTEQAFTRAFQGMEDALMSFITTGKGSFADLAKSIIADMARIELRTLMGNQMGGSGGFGGIVSGLLKMVGGLGGGYAGNLAAIANGYGTLDHAAAAGMFFDAKGGVYGSAGRIERFAKGGAFTNQVIRQPTLFRFARGGSFGTGMMGEAGDEAVMPLARDSSGRLGVRGGGSPVSITVNLSGPGSNLPEVRRASGQGAREAMAALQGARRYG